MNLFIKIYSAIRSHIMLVAMLFILFLICIGLTRFTGWTYMPEMVIHIASLLFFYFAITSVVKKNSRKLTSFLNVKFTQNLNFIKWTSYFFLIGTILFIVYHLFFLGHIPAWSAYNSLDYYGIALIRQSITEHGNTFIHYTSSLFLKSLLPFLVLYFFIKKKSLFAILLPIAIFYSLSMMQKGMIVSLFVPLIVYLFLTKKYFLSGVFAIAAIVGVMLLMVNANPSMRASEKEIKAYMEAHRREYVPQKIQVTLTETVASTSNDFFVRVVYTTGRDVGRWFELIPSQLPYANGCGYRFLAPVLGCSYKDYQYDRIIYDNLYTVEYNQGLRGTVTSAYFMYDYANFGKWGMVLAGFLLSIVLVLLNIIFDKHIRWLASLNILYALWLSNSSLFTLLLSGGWFVTIVLFWFFKPSLEKTEPNV